MQKVVGGILANYEIYGPPSPRGFGEVKEEWTVILHGWGATSGEWKQVAVELAKKYRVIVPDLPGFGGTPKPNDDWGIDDYAWWVHELIEKLGIEEYVLMGHSFGGRIGIVMAANWPIDKLVLVDAAGIEWKSAKAHIFALVSPLLRWMPQKIKNLFGSVDYKNAGEMRKIFVRVVNEDLKRLFDAVQCPTTVIWGEKDMVLPAGQARLIHQGIKGSILRIVWGANHWPHLSHFQEFMQILSEELK